MKIYTEDIVHHYS